MTRNLRPVFLVAARPVSTPHELPMRLVPCTLFFFFFLVFIYFHLPIEGDLTPVFAIVTSRLHGNREDSTAKRVRETKHGGPPKRLFDYSKRTWNWSRNPDFAARAARLNRTQLDYRPFKLNHKFDAGLLITIKWIQKICSFNEVSK